MGARTFHQPKLDFGGCFSALRKRERKEGENEGRKMKIGEEEQRAGKGSKDRGAEGKKEKKKVK